MNTGAIVLLSLGFSAFTIALVLSSLQAKAAKDPLACGREPQRDSGLTNRVPAASGRHRD